MNDPVNHPQHYTSDETGVECIDVVEHLPFCVGNAIKYVWRAGLKGPRLQDLEKAAWYLQREADRFDDSDRHIARKAIDAAVKVCAQPQMSLKAHVLTTVVLPGAISKANLLSALRQVKFTIEVVRRIG